MTRASYSYHDGDTQPLPAAQNAQEYAPAPRSYVSSGNRSNLGSSGNQRQQTEQTNRRRPRERRHASHGFLSFLLWIISAFIIAIMVIRILPASIANSGFMPLIVSFVPWLALVSALVLVPALAWRRKVLALVSVACILIQIFWHIGYIKPTTTISQAAKTAVASATINTTDKYARIMTFNTHVGTADVNEIVQTVKDQHVEVLALQEMTQGFIQRLEAAGISKVLPYSVIASTKHGDNGGVNGLWTAAPQSDANSNLIPTDASSIPAASITLGTSIVRFGSVHPNSPTRGQQSVWSSGLSTISSLKNYDHTYVLMGDFNSTWDHPSFRSLLGSKFVDSSEQAGEGFHMTYPANSKIPPLIEIDHIVHTSGVTVGDIETVQIANSDHRALLATLQAL
ncbi:MAG: endonuclease/exonuclease/phosphatase family protein [Bifidobacterium aquikefiri]|uniref:Endonuclease/exonuclease/phosphatase n=1 Tax=Bifidobacterium aquikefiri TaxID=1653207 RepID=A0A261G848_9BIFI|nr:endonuclease/exonuclease/phosphatase family protein [Bifidobacterium aquikefiri]OZG67584.1 endonuclease/exonuclease/phosphatase [Bifidobacterium aquikefiri]